MGPLKTRPLHKGSWPCCPAALPPIWAQQNPEGCPSSLLGRTGPPERTQDGDP